MKKLLALLVFCLAFTPLVVRAADWVKVAEGGITTSYVDVDSIKMSKGKIYFWYLFNYSPPLQNSPEVLSSMTFSSIIDCDLFSYRNLKNVYYSGYGGDGKVVAIHGGDEQLGYALPETVLYENIKWVCDHIENKM